MNEVTTPTIGTIKRVDLDGIGTVSGLLALLMSIPDAVPGDAEIMHTYAYEGCPPEALDNPDVEHEHGPRVGLILEWNE